MTRGCEFDNRLKLNESQEWHLKRASTVARKGNARSSNCGFIYDFLLQVHLEEGALVCPETGRRFPVSKGIPNMLLNEDEV